MAFPARLAAGGRPEGGLLLESAPVLFDSKGHFEYLQD
jgi:hypothetical protein